MKQSNSIVCTLFEGHYHYGVAALINSLYKNNYRGDVFVGYRGELPFWASRSIKNVELGWDGIKTLEIESSLSIHFLPVTTDRHFANYKPEFMLRLMMQVAKNATAVFYFDPDIVIKCEWSFFDHWVSCGVTVVHEIMYNDMPATHPVRFLWSLVIKNAGKQVVHQFNSYVNSGFCGVARQDLSFLNTWDEFINIGGKEYGADLKKISNFSKTHPFCFIDQDSLNMAFMCYQGDISEVGPDGMDFTNGGYIMSHAVGSQKPWRKKIIKNSILGIPPTLSDKQYWNYSKGIINTHSSFAVSSKKIFIKIASLIGRFYSRR